MRLSRFGFHFTKTTNIMPKKNTKQLSEKSNTIQTGPINVDKSGSIIIKINAKPGAKNNNITGIL